MSNSLTNQLSNRLRIVSAMIHMGEKISWGEETVLMDQAAAEIDKLREALESIAYPSIGRSQSDQRVALNALKRSEYTETK